MVCVKLERQQIWARMQTILHRYAGICCSSLQYADRYGIIDASYAVLSLSIYDLNFGVASFGQVVFFR